MLPTRTLSSFLISQAISIASSLSKGLKSILDIPILSVKPSAVKG